MNSRQWMLRALCRTHDNPDLWHPNTYQLRHANTRRAIRICSRCPTRDHCLNHALRHDETEGIWAGTTPRQRAAMNDRAWWPVETLEQPTPPRADDTTTYTGPGRITELAPIHRGPLGGDWWPTLRALQALESDAS